MFIQTEATPNPATLKFLPGRVVMEEGTFEARDPVEAQRSPLAKVENEITNRLYTQKMQPALRGYLAQLREESYVMVKPGYVDSAAIPGATVIQEVAPTPDAPKKKKKLPVPKASRS